MPGKPDVVLPKYNAVILVHGCFWHGHANCNKGKLPSTRIEFWSEKIGENQKRDKHIQIQLLDADWRVAVVWECAYSKKKEGESSTDQLTQWIKSTLPSCEIPQS